VSGLGFNRTCIIMLNEPLSVNYSLIYVKTTTLTCKSKLNTNDRINVSKVLITAFKESLENNY